MAGVIEKAIKQHTEVVPDEALRASDQAIGEILIAQGVMKESDVESVLAYAKQRGMQFGEAALATKKIRRKDLERALAHQYRFPYMPPGQGKLGRELVAAYKPFSRQADMFRQVRAQLMLNCLKKDQKILAVVSPSARDGRTYVAANLAIVFAQLGKKTLLLDCHLQRPRQQDLFRIDASPGISTLLSGRVEGGVKPTPIEDIANLGVLPAGANPPNPDELIASEAYARLCRKVRLTYDIVIVDTPPGSSSTAVDWIAARSGSAPIVYRRDRTRLSTARDFADRMRARTSVAGVILNSR